MGVEWNNIRIDDSIASILHVLGEQDGTATTSDVKQETRFENNNSIKYRFRKLEDADIITLENQGVNDSGQYLPLKAELTESGWELVDEHDIHQNSIRDSDAEIPDRVNLLEEKMDRILDDVWQLKRDVLELRGQVDEQVGSGDSPDEFEPSGDKE